MTAGDGIIAHGLLAPLDGQQRAVDQLERGPK
jgi:hypothetical protein